MLKKISLFLLTILSWGILFQLSGLSFKGISANSFFGSIFDIKEEDINLNCFADINATHPHAKAICNLKQNRIGKDFDHDFFHPNQNVSRAELLQIIIEASGYTPLLQDYNNCYPDVTIEWYAPFICYAREKGYLTFVPTNNFYPEQSVNLDEVLTLLFLVFDQNLPFSPEEKQLHPLQKSQKLNLLFSQTETKINKAYLAEIIYRILDIIKGNHQYFGACSPIS
jgi:hypothetical protein